MMPTSTSYQNSPGDMLGFVLFQGEHSMWFFGRKQNGKRFIYLGGAFPTTILIGIMALFMVAGCIRALLR